MRLRHKLNVYLFAFIVAACALAGAQKTDLVKTLFVDSDSDGAGAQLTEPMVEALSDYNAGLYPAALYNAFVNQAGDAMTGGLQLPDGALTSPSLSFASDTNSGIIWIEGDTLGIVTGGALRWVWGPDGAVQWVPATTPGFVKNDASGWLSPGQPLFVAGAVSYPLHYDPTNGTLLVDPDAYYTTATADLTFAPIAHDHSANAIISDTLDGDRLPAMSTTKKGGVPATGTPSGKFLRDDGSWQTAGGGTTPTLPQVIAQGNNTTANPVNFAAILQADAAGDAIMWNQTPSVWYVTGDFATNTESSVSGATFWNALTANAIKGAYDTRIHGDTVDDLIWVKAGSDQTHLKNVTIDSGVTTVNGDKGDYDFIVHGNTVDNLLFADAGNGRVGIGTSSPGVKFQVNDSGPVHVRLWNSASFTTNETVLGKWDAVGEYDSSHNVSGMGYFQVVLDAGASGNRESSLVMAPYDGTTAVRTRFYADYADGGPQICFNGASPIDPFGDPIVTVEAIFAGGMELESSEGMQSWVYSSSRDIKTDIRDVTSATAWTLLDELRPRQFAMRKQLIQWRLPDGKIVASLEGVKEADAAKAQRLVTWLDEPASSKRYVAFVAEEVPTALGGNPRGVNDSRITAANTAALKEAKRRIERLETTVAQQSALLAAMETRMRALENKPARELGASAWENYSRAAGNTDAAETPLAASH